MVPRSSRVRKQNKDIHSASFRHRTTFQNREHRAREGEREKGDRMIMCRRGICVALMMCVMVFIGEATERRTRRGKELLVKTENQRRRRHHHHHHHRDQHHHMMTIDHKCFTEMCEESEMTMTAEEGNAIAAVAYPRGSVQYTTDLNFRMIRKLLTDLKQVQDISGFIGYLLKLPAFALLAGLVMTGGANLLAIMYFAAKQAFSILVGGTSNLITRNILGGVLSRGARLCKECATSPELCGHCSVSNGIFDCHRRPSQFGDTYVLPVGDDDCAQDNPEHWGTCSANTCVGKNSDTTDPDFFHCRDDTFGNDCVCGIVVQKSSNLCYRRFPLLADSTPFQFSLNPVLD